MYRLWQNVAPDQLQPQPTPQTATARPGQMSPQTSSAPGPSSCISHPSHRSSVAELGTIKPYGTQYKTHRQPFLSKPTGIKISTFPGVFSFIIAAQHKWTPGCSKPAGDRLQSCFRRHRCCAFNRQSCDAGPGLHERLVGPEIGLHEVLLVRPKLVVVRSARGTFFLICNR